MKMIRWGAIARLVRTYPDVAVFRNKIKTTGPTVFPIYLGCDGNVSSPNRPNGTSESSEFFTFKRETVDG